MLKCFIKDFKIFTIQLLDSESATAPRSFTKLLPFIFLLSLKIF